MIILRNKLFFLREDGTAFTSKDLIKRIEDNKKRFGKKYTNRIPFAYAQENMHIDPIPIIRSRYHNLVVEDFTRFRERHPEMSKKDLYNKYYKKASKRATAIASWPIEDKRFHVAKILGGKFMVRPGDTARHIPDRIMERAKIVNKAKNLKELKNLAKNIK